MTFLAPWWLVVATGAAALTVALHLLARQRPPSAPLPTARFIPPGSARATALARRPADPWLLALRIVLLALAGAALARPVTRPERRPVARVVAIDVSRAVGAPAEVADSAAALLSSGDLLVTFDSAAGSAPVAWTGDAGGERLATLLDSLRGRGARGSISAGLVAAMRAAASLRAAADSVELVVISPFALEELDEGTIAIRERWPGAVRLVHVGPTARPAAGVPVLELRSPAGDPVAAAVALATPPATRGRVRIVRDAALSAADTAWARAGGVVVHWPAAGAAGDPVLATGWERLALADTVGAVIAGPAVVVASFARASRPRLSGEVTIVARWVDGDPAAIERRLGDGCVRAVAIPVPAVGDVALRPPFRHLLGALAAPCAHLPDETPVPGHILAALRGTGGPALATALPAPAREPVPIAPWLLGAALALALLEPLVRRRRTGS